MTSPGLCFLFIIPKHHNGFWPLQKVWNHILQAELEGHNRLSCFCWLMLAEQTVFTWQYTIKRRRKRLTSHAHLNRKYGVWRFSTVVKLMKAFWMFRPSSLELRQLKDINLGISRTETCRVLEVQTISKSAKTVIKLVLGRFKRVQSRDSYYTLVWGGAPLKLQPI